MTFPHQNDLLYRMSAQANTCQVFFYKANAKILTVTGNSYITRKTYLLLIHITMVTHGKTYSYWFKFRKRKKIKMTQFMPIYHISYLNYLENLQSHF